MGPMGPEAQVPGAGGVVFDDSDRVLVLTLAGGERVFPKGHVEAGETALETAIREVEEETGVKAWRDDPTPYTTTYVNPSGVPRRVTWFAMRSSGQAPVVRESGIRAAEFLPVHEVLESLTHETDKELLRQVLAGRQRS